MKPLLNDLMPEEKARNKHGPHLLFEYSEEELETYKSPLPDKFPDIIKNHAK